MRSNEGMTMQYNRNGEVYQLLGEVLGECSACDLHIGFSLLAKLRRFGLGGSTDSLVIQPASLIQRRQRRREQSQLAFRALCPRSSWFWSRQRFGNDPQEGAPSWNNLPQDLVLRVADDMSDEDRQVMACCCSAWKAAIGSNTSAVSFAWAGGQQLDKVDGHPMVNKVVGGASVIFRRIRTASFRRCELLDNASLTAFAKRSGSQLREMDLSGCKEVTDGAMTLVAELCPLLEILKVASCQGLTDCSFVALGTFCSRLQVLSACGCEMLSDLGLTCLAKGARSLRDVNLGWCESLTDEGIKALADNCQGLRSLDLCGCLMVGDEGIAALALHCRDLSSLGLHCCRRLTDRSQEALAAHSSNLTSLNISGCRRLSPQAVQAVLDSNPGLHTCGGMEKNVIVAGCLHLLAVTCKCPTPEWNVPSFGQQLLH